MVSARSERQLVTDDVCVRFGGLDAVVGVDCAVAAGEILGLIGPNGAGKTTLVNVITGFQRPTRGRVLLGGADVTGWSPARLARTGVARTFQGTRIFPALTALENVEAGAVGVGLSRAEARARAWEILERMDLAKQATRWGSTLAQGDERRVGIARAVATHPDFLLLDEPAAGLNDAETQRLVADLQTIRRDLGCGIVVIEHDMAFITGVCDRIHVLDRGTTLAVGSSDEVQRDPKVKEAYLGSESESNSAGSSMRTRNAAPAESRSRPPLLRVADLEVSYGSVRALRRVSLNVAEGELVAVVGPNGAGKSTLLQTVAGAVSARGGEILLRGKRINRLRPEARVAAGLALVPEGRRIFGDLTVEENLKLGATSGRGRNGGRSDLAEVIDRFPILRERLRSAAGGLSGGEQQQLAIGRALMARPDLLLLDEPSLGLGPKVIGTVFEALEELRNEGRTILLVEQFVRKALEVADRVYGLREGVVEVQGAKDDVSLQSDLTGIYLGAPAAKPSTELRPDAAR